jgi:hypothetical protein
MIIVLGSATVAHAAIRHVYVCSVEVYRLPNRLTVADLTNQRQINNCQKVILKPIDLRYGLENDMFAVQSKLARAECLATGTVAAIQSVVLPTLDLHLSG